MIITSKIEKMDLAKPWILPALEVMQDDKYSRDLEFTLFENGKNWEIPTGSTATIQYHKSDGTGGNYTAMPDDTTAYTVSGNVLTVKLAPQVCTAPGKVDLSVCLTSGSAQLHTFTVHINVHRNPGLVAHSENYFKIAGALADSGWEPNMYLGTGPNGNVIAVKAPDGGSPDGSQNAPVQSVNGKTGAVNLSASDVGARPASWTPTAQEVGALPDTYTPPNQTAQQVGADPAGTAESKVSAHNTDNASHNDLRLELKALSDRLTAFFDSDDTTLDELSEIVAYIKANKSLIDSISTSKVSVTDIVNDLVTNVANKPLSAAQGVALKKLIDTLSSGKLDASALTAAIEQSLSSAKASGEFDGADGERGTGILKVTTAPSSYTTATGGFTPAYRIALSTVLSQSKADKVLIGDTVLYSYYTYPVGYVDSSYVYLGARVSIRGAEGTSVTITSVSESTESGGANTATFSDGKTMTVMNGKDGKNGDPGYTPIRGKDYWTAEDIAAMKADLASEIEETPFIVLPRKIYAVAGHEFVLYYRNILRAMRTDDFVVTTSFESGSSLPPLQPLYDGMLRFTPTADNAGEHKLTILVKSRRTWKTVATKSVTLVISEDAARTDRRVMFIGDSLTYASTYAAEVQNLSGDGIMSIGTISHSISFNGGTASIKSEGRNSAASYDYVNKQTFAGYDNPFYNPDKEYTLTLDSKYTTGLLNLDNTGSVSVLKHHFDFAYYMANNGATLGEPDAVFINLGTNGGNRLSYEAVFIAFDAMIERIKAYNADLPIFLHLFPPKSEAGSTDRTAGGTVSGWLNERTWYYDIIQTFIDRYDNDSRVFLVPTYTMLDPVYDYKRETVTVSARNSEQITIGQNDGTHPATSGYLHMADSYYNALQALLSGGTDTIYHTITKNLGDHVSISNSANTVAEGAPYSATLIVDNGYTLDSVSVTMGGEPVTVSGGVISIYAVTGNIVITATAVETEEEPTVVNLVDPSTANDASPDLAIGADEWVNGYYISSAGTDSVLSAANGIITTDRFPITDTSVIRIWGLDISTTTYKNRTRMVIGMDSGGIFREMALPFADSTNGSGATLLNDDGSLSVTVSKFGQAASWAGKVWARFSGRPVDGNNSNVIVTVE